MGPDRAAPRLDINGQPRTRLAAKLAKRYTAGESIRALAADIGRSYGLVYQLLQESGTTLRSRGRTVRTTRKAQR